MLSASPRGRSSSTSLLAAIDRIDSPHLVERDERRVFVQTVREMERTLRDILAAHDALPTDRTAEAALQRPVIRRALVELGLLSINRRLVSLPLKRPKMAMIL